VDRAFAGGELPARPAGLPGWHGDTSGISRDYPAGWDAAATMVPEIAALAVEMAHRPDLDIRVGAARVHDHAHRRGRRDRTRPRDGHPA
jgi:pterin-4a-carbinolamine dehydratase